MSAFATARGDKSASNLQHRITYNILHCCQRLSHGHSCYHVQKILWSLDVWLLRYCKWTDKHTDMLIALLCTPIGGKAIKNQNIGKWRQKRTSCLTCFVLLTNCSLCCVSTAFWHLSFRNVVVDSCLFTTKTSGYATWFTAGGAIRIGHYDVIDDVITRKL